MGDETLLPACAGSGGARPLSLRGHLHGYDDPVRCSFATRMSFQIDLREPRHIGGPDRITERVFVAPRKAGRRFQIDTHAVGAGDVGRFLQPSVSLARTGRPAQIEIGGANGNLDRDLMGPGLNRCRKRAGRR
jgi:hypothetical protein